MDLVSSKRTGFLWFLAFGIILLFVLLYCWHSYLILKYPWQMEYTEGFAMGYAADWTHNIPLYQPINEPPYRVMAYVPLYFFLTGFLIKLFGIHLLIGRLVSIVATLLIALTIYLILRKELTFILPKFLLPFLGSGIFLTGRYVFRYTQFFRPDTTAIFFALLALFIALNEHKFCFQILAVCVAIIGVFFKQNHIWALIAIIWTVSSKNRKQGLYLTLLAASLTTIFLGIGNILTNGQFFQQVVSFNMFNEFNWDHALSLIILFIAKYSIFIYLSFMEIIKQKADGSLTLLHRYFLLVLFALITIGKVGSQVHYFLEITAALSIIVPFSMQRLYLLPRYKTIATIFPVLVIFEVITVNLHNDVATAKLPTLEEGKARQQICEIMMKKPDPILSEDATLVVLSDHSIYIDPFLCSQLNKFNLWNDAPIIKKIEKHKFSIVCLQFNLFDEKNYKWHKYRFTPQIIKALRKNYKLFNKYSDLYLYLPNPNPKNS